MIPLHQRETLGRVSLIQLCKMHFKQWGGTCHKAYSVMRGDVVPDDCNYMLSVASLQYQNRFMIHQPTQCPHMHRHALANTRTLNVQPHKQTCTHLPSNQLWWNTINIQFHQPLFSAVDLKRNEELPGELTHENQYLVWWHCLLEVGDKGLKSSGLNRLCKETALTGCGGKCRV